MREIAVFVEDFAHEQVLKALVPRIASERDLTIRLLWRNARRGHGAVVNELKQLLRDLQRGRGPLPDLVIAATDGNCKGFAARRSEIVSLTDRVSLRTVCAIPDPHIERWLMLDSAAFRDALGVGCDAPDQKCERDRYKQLLRSSIRKAGITPSLGGIEFAEDIITRMDIDRSAAVDASFGHFVSDLRAIFREWIRRSPP